MEQKPINALTFRELYEQYKGMVFNLALQYVQNVEDAEEITQDVFIAAHKSFAAFKGQSKYSTWLYRITINKALDHIKSKKRQKRFAFLQSIFSNNNAEMLIHPANFDHPGVLLEQKESLALLFTHINELPSNQKTAIILSKIEHKTLVEIAEIMNISTKAVESLLHRAKLNLKKKYK